MATFDLHKDNFSETYENNDIVIVDFWAPWCGPCLNFIPTFEKVSEEYPDVVFAKVNTEIEQEIAQHYMIRSVPTIMVLREGYEVFFNPGALSEDDLKTLITKVKELDMNEVKKQLESEDSEQA